MESILVPPENAEQLKVVKAFLKELKVRFEPQSSTFPHTFYKVLKKAYSSMKMVNHNAA